MWAKSFHCSSGFTFSVLHLSFLSFAASYRFILISLHLAPFSFLFPANIKHLNSMMLPPLCFVVGRAEQQCFSFFLFFSFLFGTSRVLHVFWDVQLRSHLKLKAGLLVAFCLTITFLYCHRDFSHVCRSKGGRKTKSLKTKHIFPPSHKFQITRPKYCGCNPTNRDKSQAKTLLKIQFLEKKNLPAVEEVFFVVVVVVSASPPPHSVSLSCALGRALSLSDLSAGVRIRSTETQGSYTGM